MSRPPRTATPDARYRPFRVAAYAVYLIVVALFSTLLIISVIRSILSMTPAPEAPKGPIFSVRECANRADRLWEELDEQRKALSNYPRRRAMDEQWSQFRIRWLQQLHEVEAACATQSRSRHDLKKGFELLEQLQDLYATHAVQFAGEIGRTLEEFRTALESAQR